MYVSIRMEVALLTEKIRLLNLLAELGEKDKDQIRARLGGIDFALSKMTEIGVM